MFGDDFHGATNIAPLHVFRPNQRRPAVGSGQIDLSVAIAEHMHMSWLMIVHKDDEAQAVRTMNRDHQAL